MKGEQFGPDRSGANEVTKSWQSIITMAPQGFILRQILLNVFIYDLSAGPESVLSKFGDYTKLEELLTPLRVEKALQRDLDRLESWEEAILTV